MRRMSLMGILMMVSCLITGVFYAEYLTSVWCFFAAITSGVIYWILSEAPVTVRPESLWLIRIPDNLRHWPRKRG